MRIVSLVPSLTETLDDWGRPPIAGTRFCARAGLARVGGTKDPDLEAIAALEPDLVVLDEEENRREDYEALLERGLAVYACAVRSLGDLEGALAGLADAVGVNWSVPAWPPTPPVRLRAVVPIWRRPWIALGGPTYATSLLGAVGVANVLADRGAYPRLELAAMADARPDVVLAPSEPYPFAERHRRELEAVAPVVLVDGRDLFWWGSRTPGALARLGDDVARWANLATRS